jgi:hypothetical protein
MTWESGAEQNRQGITGGADAAEAFTGGVLQRKTEWEPKRMSALKGATTVDE